MLTTDLFLALVTIICNKSFPSSLMLENCTEWSSAGTKSNYFKCAVMRRFGHPQKTSMALKPAIKSLGTIFSNNFLPGHEHKWKIGTEESNFFSITRNLENFLPALDSQASDLPISLSSNCCTVSVAYASTQLSANVLKRAGCHAATKILLQGQLLFGKAPRKPMYCTSFIPGSLQSTTSRYVRRVGRPRREWVTEIRSQTFQVFDGHRELARLVRHPTV